MSDPWTTDYLEKIKEENTRLRALNAQLLEALKENLKAQELWVMLENLDPNKSGIILRMRAVIALAEKEGK